MENLLSVALFFSALSIILIIFLVIEWKNSKKIEIRNAELRAKMSGLGDWKAEADRRQDMIKVMEEDYKNLMIVKDDIAEDHLKLVCAAADHRLEAINLNERIQNGEADFETLIAFIQAQSDENKWLRDKLKAITGSLHTQFSKDAINKMFLN